MATLDTTGISAVRFQAITIQTIGADDFSHAAGSTINLPESTTSITVNVTTKVACMRSPRIVSGEQVSDFVMDEIRTPA